MNRYAQFLMAWIAAVGLAACGTLEKKACDKTIDTLTTGTAVLLECDAPNEIRKDIVGIAHSVKLCEKIQQTGFFADMACPIIVPPIVNYIVDKPIPDRWKCRKTVAKEKASEFLVGLCRKIPVDERSAALQESCEEVAREFLQEIEARQVL